MIYEVRDGSCLYVRLLDGTLFAVSDRAREGLSNDPGNVENAQELGQRWEEKGGGWG